MSRAQLARLIDLPDDALQQVLDYALTLSKADAVDHFKNLLGDSPAAIAFIADFNSRRHDPAGPSSAAAAAAAVKASTPSATPAAATSRSTEIDAVPKPHRGSKKKKAPLHTPPPRQLAQLAPPPGSAYNKKDAQDDYIVSRPSAVQSGSSTTLPLATNQQQQQQQQQQRKPPSAAGSMIQDVLQPKGKGSKASSGSRTNAKPMAKITITGGTAMQGASTALADFDAAIRALEISTNPTLAGSGGNGVRDVAARRCNCVATRHPLQTAAPNCLHCGKVICLKEGLGPCTFCGQPLLTADEVQAMIRELREERGREKMAADKAAHRRPDVAGAAKPYARPTMIAGSVKWGGDDADFVSLAEAQAQARAHRDKLLGFQAENAQRTTVRDEAADFDVGEAMAAAAAGGAGGSQQNLWATPEERARALRRQQKLLREMEWNARPEYEKRRQVVSIDLAGRKVFRKTVAAERPPTPPSDDGAGSDEDYWERSGTAAAGIGAAATGGGSGGSSGTFSNNPLLGRLIRPVYEPPARRKKAQPKGKGKDKGKGKGKGKSKEGKAGDDAGSDDGDDGDDGTEPVSRLPGRNDDPAAASRWQRVQDDLHDNEAIILDGGIYGAGGSDEPGRG